MCCSLLQVQSTVQILQKGRHAANQGRHRQDCGIPQLIQRKLISQLIQRKLNSGGCAAQKTRRIEKAREFTPPKSHLILVDSLITVREIHFFSTRTTFFQARPLFSKRIGTCRSDALGILFTPAPSRQWHGRARRCVRSGRRCHGTSRYQAKSPLFKLHGPTGRASPGTKSITIRDDDIKNICV